MHISIMKKLPILVLLILLGCSESLIQASDGRHYRQLDDNTRKYIFDGDNGLSTCLTPKDGHEVCHITKKDGQKYKLLERDVIDYIANGKFKIFHPNGNLRSETTTLNGLWHGKATLYNEHHTMMEEIQYKHAIADGEYKIFDIQLNKSKTLREDGFYKNGVRTGKFTRYSTNGQINTIGTYSNGCADGKFIKFYGNDKKQVEINYKNCLPNGFAKEFFIDGKIMAETSFRAGRFHGDFKIFEDGKLFLTISYQDGVAINGSYADGKSFTNADIANINANTRPDFNHSFKKHNFPIYLAGLQIQYSANKDEL